jgi:two-component system, LuxR family, sensor kinase FixL
MGLFSFYLESKKRRCIAAALAITVIIAFADWRTTPYIALGFLYLFPIILISGFVRRRTIIVFALICAILQEAFSNLPVSDAFTRLVLSLAGFAGTGLFVHAMARHRQMTLAHLLEIEGQMQLRRDAEEQLRVLVDTSPAAILILDETGAILLANASTRQMLAASNKPLTGEPVVRYLPALHSLATSNRSLSLHSTIQCRGTRKDGEVFLAGVWFSIYATSTGRKLAAIVVDISDDLRDREDLSLDYLLKNAHILMSAFAHEAGNLSATAEVFYRNIENTGVLAGNHDFEALGQLVEGLSKLSITELLSTSRPHDPPRVALDEVMDELHILLISTLRESGIEIDWRVNDTLPMVIADSYSLMQVFLNLVKNSRRAMEHASQKLLTVESSLAGNVMEIHLKDSGPGIADPQLLFRPFQREATSSGLGLYISRTLMRSFGGDLIFKPSDAGCHFILTLLMAQDENDEL